MSGWQWLGVACYAIGLVCAYRNLGGPAFTMGIVATDLTHLVE